MSVWFSESGPCALFEKGMDHADVVNYKAGMVHGASQRMCVSVYVPLRVHAFLYVRVHVHDDVCVFLKGLQPILAVLYKW